ncbi:hypothetical protein V7795_35260 [Rhizobium laguerreae]
MALKDGGRVHGVLERHGRMFGREVTDAVSTPVKALIARSILATHDAHDMPSILTVIGQSLVELHT